MRRAEAGMTGAEPLVEFLGVVKDYQSLRPLRIAELRVPAGTVVSLGGVDAQGAEVLVNLMTAAMQPDAGAIRLFGRPTAAIVDHEAWLQMLDGLGLLTARAVLLAQCTVAQNLALPFTIQIDPVREDVWPQVRAIADEVGIPAAALDTRVGGAGPDLLQRVRLGRALALAPRLLVAEHPSADLPREAVGALARDLARIAAARGIGVLAVSADREFTRALGGTPLMVDPSTGRVSKAGLLSRLGLG